MNIRNRRADIVKLRNDVCQDFLKITLKPNWKDYIEEIYTNDNEHYKKALNVLNEKGINAYSIDDMDVSLMWALYFYDDNDKKRKNKIFKTNSTKNFETTYKFAQIKDDRNLTQHSCENEDDSDLYDIAICFLYNIKEFVKSVDKIKDLDSSIIKTFRNSYIEKIQKLKSIIKKEQFEYESRKKTHKDLLYRIKLSEDPEYAFLKIYNDHYLKKIISPKDSDRYETYCFLKAAYNEGFSFVLESYIMVIETNRLFEELYQILLEIVNKNELSTKDLQIVINTINFKDVKENINIFPLIKRIEEKGFSVKERVREISGRNRSKEYYIE